MHTRITIAIGAAVLAMVAALAPPALRAQGGAALTGTVSSEQEPRMEGVVVTARREGSPISVSVVTDANGKYAFPQSHVQPGQYTVTMRAVGYDLPNPGSVEVSAGKSATLNLSVTKTGDLSKQLTSREWALSLPEKSDMLEKTVYNIESCVYCHSLERIMRTKLTAEQLVPTITRMLKY